MSATAGGSVTCAAVEPADDDEADGFRAPLPPADRVWRHPAEIAAASRHDGARRRRRRRRGRALFFTASALSGAGLVLLALAAIGEFSDDDRTPVAAATSLPERGDALAPTTTATFDDDAVAEASIAAIARIRATGPDGVQRGSGVFLPDDGFVLAPATLVAGADEVVVSLDSGVELLATVRGADLDSDVAVIEVAGRNLPHAVLGSADDLVAGDRALLLDANRDGIRLTVSSVVATRRRVELQDRAMHGMVQIDVDDDTDRAGVVLGSDGRVVDIATAHTDRPGYVTTIDWAMRIAADLMADGEVHHAWLGIEGVDVRPDDADVYGSTDGARVVTVIDGGPAALASLEADDVIVGVDDLPVRSMSDLVLAVRPHHPGDRVRVRYLRDGEERTCEPVLGTADDRSTVALVASRG